MELSRAIAAISSNGRRRSSIQLMLESPSHSDDADLLRLLSAGNEAAFLEFYQRYQSVVYRFALQMSGKVQIAEEVTQDVFMAVMRAARYDPNRGSVLAFLYGIARNLTLRCLDKEKPYLTSLDGPEGEYRHRIADAGDLDRELSRNERIANLRKAVLALPTAYREVVVLCDLQEMDYADAANVLGCALGTVRSRLHRARALLMEKMRATERCAV